MSAEPMPSALTPLPDKRMKLRYAGTCRVCSAELAARVEAICERQTKTVRCLDCSATPAAVDATSAAKLATVAEIDRDDPDSGVAGASARREYERRKTKRERGIRAAHPRLGGLILAVTDEPQSTTAWARGAVGEEKLGRFLDRLESADLAVLHDRRIPGTRANIDHLVISGSGVWVVDTKRYKGRPELRIEGGILRPCVEKLIVGRRDRTKLIDGVLRQIDVLEAVLPEVTVTGAMCFVDADWPLIGGFFTSRGVHVVSPKRLGKMLAEETTGLLDVAATCDLIARFLPAA